MRQRRWARVRRRSRERALADTIALDPRAQQLYDEGARLLASKWDDDAGLVRYETANGVFHDARGSLAYADVLLREGVAESITRAERILEIIASMQETHDQDAHCGNFRWFFEDAVVRDLNAVEFVLDLLNALIREHAGVLSGPASASIRGMIALGLREIDRLDVHPSYTNIALSDICNSVLGGEAIGDETYVERGRRRLDEWFAFTDASGAPHEFNSPTYAAVDIGRMAALAEHTRDGEIALKARIAEERLWLHSAAHYHPRLAQIAGPHSRSYRDGWTGAGGYLKLALWRLLGDDTLRRVTPYFPQGREEGHTGVALANYHCPAYALDLLREKRWPFEARETSDAAAGLDLTTYMTESYALGSASRSYAVGDPPEPSQQQNSLLLYFARSGAPGYGALQCRYIANDRDRAADGELPLAERDLWDEGRHVSAQRRHCAIVAYGLQPRIRPVHSYKLSVRLLGVGPGAEVWCGGAPVRVFPHPVQPLEPIIVSEGGVYIAIIPLAQSDMGSRAPLELEARDGVLTLDIYNYRGPAKSFWEYQSLGGAFYKGNVRNGFVIEVAEGSTYGDVDAFRRHIAEARVTDTVDGKYEREITYASDGGEIAMKYSLWDLRLIERGFDGAVYVPPIARVGAVDGGGLQWAQSAESEIALGGAKAVGAGAKSFTADAERRRYILLRTTNDPAPMRLETPRTSIECDAFGFGRIQLDEGAGTLAVEAVGALGELRVRSEPRLRVTVNGIERGI